MLKVSNLWAERIFSACHKAIVLKKYNTMKISSLSLLTALLSVALFLSPAHAQNVGPVEVSDELVASLKVVM